MEGFAVLGWGLGLGVLLPAVLFCDVVQHAEVVGAGWGVGLGVGWRALFGHAGVGEAMDFVVVEAGDRAELDGFLKGVTDF